MAFFNLTDSVQGDIGEVMAETHIQGEKADGLTVRYVLIDQHSQISAETIVCARDRAFLQIHSPELWDGRRNPALYGAQAELYDHGSWLML